MKRPPTVRHRVIEIDGETAESLLKRYSNLSKYKGQKHKNTVIFWRINSQTHFWYSVMRFVVFFTLLTQAFSQSCFLESNKQILSKDEYFLLENGSFFNVIKNARDLLHENVTSFVFNPQRGQLYFTNESGLFSFTERIIESKNVRVLSLLDNKLFYTKGSQFCYKTVLSSENCFLYVVVGILFSSITSAVLTLTVPRAKKRLIVARPLLETNIE